MLLSPQAIPWAWVQACSAGQVLRGPTPGYPPPHKPAPPEAWLPRQGPACGSLKNKGLFPAGKQVTAEKTGPLETADSLLLPAMQET